MKLFIVLAALFCSDPAYGMMWLESVVISAADLQRKGFTIEVKRAREGIPTVEISVHVPEDTSDESFLFTQLMIVDHEVSQSEVKSTDAVGESLHTTTKNERDATFILVGKQADCAYLTFDFKCPDDRSIPHQRRYLLAISSFFTRKKEANQPSEPTRFMGLRFRTARLRSTAPCQSEKTARPPPRAAHL
jgi:hypothetical protein